MPVPTPNPGEPEDKFISRCISTMSRTDSDREHDQIIAICHSQWKESVASAGWHPQFKRILSLFLSKHGEKIGLEKLNKFIANHRLNPSLPYHPKFQFKEGFQWAEPGIKFFKEDKQAKYYKISCLHAIISMNNRDYENWKQMMAAGKSINYRPINLNHDHTRWQPYPRTRLDYGKAEDYCVEGILRVDNQEKRLQMQLEHHPDIPEKEWISHPSIEGRPDLGGMEKEGYHFTALSLLEKGYQLPGDPLTEIAPLMMESVGEVCMIVGGEKMCLPCTEQELQEAPRTEEERAKSHFNISDEEWNALSPEKKADYISRLPPRGSAPESTSKEGKKINKNIEEVSGGNINPEGAVCPQCGHKITPDPTIEASAINCPRCDTVMKRLPVAAYEQLEAEHIIELFRPPFNGDMKSYAKRFKKTTGADLKVSNPPTVGPVAGATIGIVEHQEVVAKLNGEIAKVTAEATRNAKGMLSLKTQLSEKAADLDEALEQLAVMTRSASKVDDFKVKTGQLSEEVIDRENTIKAKVKEIEQKDNLMASKDVRIDRLSKEVTKINEALEKVKLEYDDVRLERNDLSVKARGSEEKALNETKERSRVLNDNAKLLDDKRMLTKEVSDLSEKLAEASKRELVLQQELATQTAKVGTTEGHYETKLAEMTNNLDRARISLKRASKLLKKAGYVPAK